MAGSSVTAAGGEQKSEDSGMSSGCSNFPKVKRYDVLAVARRDRIEKRGRSALGLPTWFHINLGAYE